MIILICYNLFWSMLASDYRDPNLEFWLLHSADIAISFGYNYFLGWNVCKHRPDKQGWLGNAVLQCVHTTISTCLNQLENKIFIF
jgi:hypothetical protein